MKPMLATTGPLPAGPGWAYELKWDGVRAIADIAPDGMRLTSRTEREMTTVFPELYGLAEACPDALLDGEIVAFADGRPSFETVAPRLHAVSGKAARRLAAEVPATLLVFDVLRLYGVDLTGRPYAERRATLDRLDLAGPAWAVPPAFDDSVATVAASVEARLEGVVAKRSASTYRPGIRSRDWIKLRHVLGGEFVVGGFQAGAGERSGGIGALAVGYYEGDELRYAGQVGSGLSGPTLRALQQRLRPLVVAQPPFTGELTSDERRGMTWCRPEVVVAVRFAQWTAAGRLRFPIYLGIREDKEAGDVRRE